MSERLRTEAAVDDRPSADLEVVEIPLLLPGWQVEALENAAHARGVTAAEMLRTVLRQFIDALPAGSSHGRSLLADV
jgi:hypothetical protein